MFEFNKKPHSLAMLPVDNAEFARDADRFVSGVEQWKKNKTYSYKLDSGRQQSVQTFYQTVNGEFWLARVSEHDATEHSFSRVVDLIAGDSTDRYAHTRNEMEYIHVLNKWEPVELSSLPGYSEVSDPATGDLLDKHANLKEWVAVSTQYELGAPLTTREFNEFILVYKQSPTCCFVISLVSNQPVSGKHVHGVYCSIEKLQLNEETNKFKWSMCTCSDSGGNVPKFLQNAMIAKSVASDVPSFLNWMDKK